MKIFCYSNRQTRAKALAKGIGPLTGSEDLLVCTGLQELSKELVRPGHGIRIGVLAMEDGREIIELFGLKSILHDIRLIILLEEESQETVALAHQLKPRYLGPRDQSLDEVKGVLRSMIDRMGQLDRMGHSLAEK